MDGYEVELSALKECKKLITKGEWRRSKKILKELANDDNFACFSQIDKCFITRFLGERFKLERKFDEAVHWNNRYFEVAKGLPVEEQRALATLGSTYLDASSSSKTKSDKLKVLDCAERYTMLAVKTARRLCVERSNATVDGVGRWEAGHMMARGLYNLALVKQSRGGESSISEAISCLKKAVKVFQDFTSLSTSTSSTNTRSLEIDAFFVTLYLELATLYRLSNRINDLWEVATDGFRVAEKLLSSSTTGRERTRSRKMIAKFKMHKAFASVGQRSFQIAYRLADEALKTLTASSSSDVGRVKHRRRSSKNEYAMAEDFDNDDDEEENGVFNTNEMSTEIHSFKRTSGKLAKLAKKLSRLQKQLSSMDISAKRSKAYLELVEKIGKIGELMADNLFDVGVFEAAKSFYEQALDVRNQLEAIKWNEGNHKCLFGIIISIGRCLLNLGRQKDFDEIVDNLSKKSTSDKRLENFQATDMDLIAFYEIAVDHFIENENKEDFCKYLKKEFHFRSLQGHFDENSSPVIRRLGEISKKIVITCEEDNSDDVESFVYSFNGLLDEFMVDRDAVASAAAAAAVDSDSESSAGEDSSQLSSISALSSSDEDVENEDAVRKAADFHPLRLKRNEKGETQLHIACRTANVKKADQLLKLGHPVNVVDGSRWFPIHDAADAGCFPIMKLLIANGADINCSNELNGLTPGMEAAKNGHLANYRQVLRLLIAKGANCDAKDTRARAIINFLRDSRRENEAVMSSEDLADWMELESLVLSKMRKKPTRSFEAPTKSTVAPVKPAKSISSSQSSSSSSPSARSDAGSNLPIQKASAFLAQYAVESAGESDGTEKSSSPIEFAGGKSKPKDDAVHLYQTAIGGVGRSAKPGKRKVVIDGEPVQPVDGKSRKLHPLASKALVANNPFLDNGEPEDWLVDDVGGAASGRKQTTLGPKKLKQSKAQRKFNEDMVEKPRGNWPVPSASTANDQSDDFFHEFDAGNSMTANDLDDILFDISDNFDGTRRSSFSGRPSSSPISTTSSRRTGTLPNYCEPSSKKLRTSLSRHQRIEGNDANDDSDFLTIRVHIDRPDIGSCRGRRDSLLINNIGDLTWDIQRLRSETNKRYAALFGQSPIISSMRLLDGTTLADDSRLAPIARQHGELVAVVDRWELPPLLDRYRSACSILAVPPISNNPSLDSSLSTADLTGRLDLTNMFLPSSQMRCILKALQHQTNVNTICLAGNRCSIGTGTSTDNSVAKALAEAMSTLPSLSDLDLSLTNLDVEFLEQMGQTFATIAKNNQQSDSSRLSTIRLRRLVLSYNSFLLPTNSSSSNNRFVQNNLPNSTNTSRFAEILSGFLTHFSATLRRLSLASCDLDGSTFLSSFHDRLLLTEVFQSFHELTELDLSHNRRLGQAGLDFLITRALPINQLTVLNLSGSLRDSHPSPSYGQLISHVLKSAVKLVELRLSSNTINDRDISEFALDLGQSKCLSSLELSANFGIHSSGLSDLTRCLKFCPSLGRLDLSSTSIASPIDFQVFNHLADKMDCTGPLSELILPEGRINDSELASFKQVLNCSNIRKKPSISISCSLQLI